MKNFAFMAFMFDLKRVFNIEEVANYDGLDNVRAAFNAYGADKVAQYFGQSEFKAMRVIIVDNCTENGVIALTNDAVIISIRSWVNVDSFVALLRKHIRAVGTIYNKSNEIIITF